jgi:hypothetical protein
MEITRSSTDGATAKGPAEWFTGDVYIDSVAAPVAPSPRAGEPCPLHAGRPHGLASSSARAEPVRHRGDRAMSTRRRTGRGHSPRATASTSSPMRSTGTVPPPAG